MHAAALAAAGIGLTYEALDVDPDALGRVMESLRAEAAAGNVTVPHKESVFELCERTSDVARRTRAVNTFWCDGAALVGDNTDVAGFDAAARALCDGSPPRRVALIGAGGSASAVAAAVTAWPGSSLMIWSRTAARAAALSLRFAPARAEEDLPHALAGADLVVHATPVGLHEDRVLFDPALLPEGTAVLDLVYRRGPIEPPLVRAARAAGLRAADGRAMLVEQGALAFQRWLGIEPDRAAMWAALTRPPGGM